MATGAAPRSTMKVSPKARPLTVQELMEFRELVGQMRRLIEARRALGPYVPLHEAAKLLGLKPRTLRGLVKEGAFPHSWKPAENRVHLFLPDIEAYIAARRVEVRASGLAPSAGGPSDE